MTDDHVVAIGFLTQHDLMILGRGFDNYIDVDHSGAFETLVKRVNGHPPCDTGKEIVLTFTPKPQ